MINRALEMALMLLPLLGLGEIRMPQIFGSGMVLQTNRDYGARAFVFGTAVRGETVHIAGLSRRSLPGAPYLTVVRSDGTFRVQLDPYQGPEVYNCTVTGSVSTNVVTLLDVVYGDVFLCSGQSK